MSTKTKHGWTKRERELVRLWVAQISINRHRHQLASDSFAKMSFRLQLISIIITAAGAVFSFVSSYFNNDPEIVRALTIVAGVLALISALFAGIFATLSPDTNSEKHRQTGIHYANYSNEIQAVLVEENDDLLPRASEFLARIRNGIHLLQSFGPSLDETADSDLPSNFLLRDFDNKTNNQHTKPSTTLTSLPTGYDMFKRDDDPETASARAERRRLAFEQLRKDKEELAARKRQILDEERDIENAIVENEMTLKKAKSSGDVTQSMPVLATQPPVTTSQKNISAPTPLSPRAVLRDNIGSDSDSSGGADHLAHGSDTDTSMPTLRSVMSAAPPHHHESALETIKHAIGGTAQFEENAKRVRAELRRKYKALQKAKEQIVDMQIACENRTSELESDERVNTPQTPRTLQQSGVVAKLKSVLKKSLSPPPPMTEQDVIEMQTQKVKELGLTLEDMV